MVEVSVKIDSNSELIKQASAEAIAAALEAIGLQAEGYAKLLCPVDTGNLRNSITHTTQDNEKAVYIGSNVEYAAYVEMGTDRNAPQPYIEPAVTDHSSEYKDIVEGMLKNS